MILVELVPKSNPIVAKSSSPAEGSSTPPRLRMVSNWAASAGSMLVGGASRTGASIGSFQYRNVLGASETVVAGRAFGARAEARALGFVLVTVTLGFTKL